MEAHLTSQPIVTGKGGGLSLRARRPGCEEYHSLVNNVNVKNEWNHAATPPLGLRVSFFNSHSQAGYR
jgi:hypothetical protein